jgi:all-trans-retinol 13,14-reductase
MDTDIIVIGSGAGGLAAALPLAQSGKRVTVIEQHNVPGGLCHSFRSGGYRYSPGIHYVGQIGEGGFVRGLYEGLGVADDLTFYEMNPDGYEHVLIGNEHFDIPSGKQATIERFKQRFPAEAKGISEYFNLVEKICHQLPVVPETRTFLEFLTVPFRTREMGRYGLFSLKHILDSRINDPLLKALLSIQCGDHGLPPSKTPFALHAAVVGHYLEGGYYPKGGGRAIPRAFVRALKKNGGKLMLSTSVEQILTERQKGKERAIGVRLADGTEIRANTVISNASPNLTYEQLVGRDKLSHKLSQKLDKATYSTAALVLYLATDLDLVGMGMDSGNYWYTESADLEAYYQQTRHTHILESDECPGVFLGITTLKDPESFRNGHHTIEVVSFISYDLFRQWQQTKYQHRPEEYYALKRKLTAAMLKTVERIIPGISSHLLHCELSTPLTNEHYVRSTEGSCYGTEKTLRQIGPFGFNCRSEIDNLYLCGAGTTAHGLSGATTSGMGVAASLLGCRPSELLRKTGQKLNVIPRKG